MNRRTFLGLLAAAPVALRLPLPGELEAAAQIERRGELYPLVGPYNYALKKNYRTVYRYLNAVDIGHAQLARSEEHTSELQSLAYLVCRLQLEKKKKKQKNVNV